MFSTARQESSTIMRLRVRAPGLDPLTARLRAEFALNTADLRPPGLPPSVVLCVRRLRDPRPGGLDLSQPGQSAGAGWQQAVRDALARLAREAARPAREPVPAGAQAVLFADQGELLACLARDWLAGSLPDHWWWQSLLRGLEPDRLVVQAWVEAPAYLPAALEGLAGQGLAADFAARLTAPAALRILSAALDHAGLNEVREAVIAYSTAPARAETSIPAHAGPPWQLYAPESRSNRLELPQAALLGIGLSLRRAPHFVRAPGFAVALRLWLAERAAVQEKQPGIDPENRMVQPAPPPAVPSDQPSSWAKAADAPKTTADEPPPATPSSRTQPESASAPESYDSIPEQPRSAAPLAEAIHPLPATPAPPKSPDQAAAEPGPVQQEDPQPQDEAPAWWPEPLEGQWFETRLGGLFTLINLGLSLGLYNDFTRPLEPGLDLSIWDFLALLGRALLGEDPPGAEPDPLWSWLARLAGRAPADLPGAAFRPDPAWRVPPAWLLPFPPGAAWRWSAQAGRLRVAHPAGFDVLDVPLENGPVAQILADELRPFAVHFDALEAAWLDPPEAFPWAASPSLARWLGWLMAYARARLCLALGLPDPSGLADLVCARPARVYLTETHIDITFPLSSLPVPVRLAGLDRDPGWLPAANRYVMFYYDE